MSDHIRTPARSIGSNPRPASRDRPVTGAKSRPLVRIIAGINYGSSYWPLRHDVVEARYGARYVGDFCIKTAVGWSNIPVAVYFLSEPPESGSRYLGIYLDQAGRLFLCGADSVTEGTWTGAVAENGEIVFSRFCHDYRASSDGTVEVDGGRDYFHGNATELVPLRMIDGYLVPCGSDDR